MALPTIIASNQTAGAIFFDRLGLTVPASGTLELTLFAFIDEINNDETLYAAILADQILLDYGQGVISKGDSLKFFNIQTSEVKIPVRLMSDTNIASLSGTMTIDSILGAVSDRILLTGQGTGSENGIWVMNSGAWTRPDDFGSGQSSTGAMVFIDQGTIYSDQIWVCTTNSGSDVIDTDTLAFSLTSGGEGLQSTYDNGIGGDGVAGRIVTNATDGRVLVSGTERLQVTATTGLDVDTIVDFDVTTFDVLMTGTNGFSIDGTAASNLSVDAGDLSISTSTSGSALIDGIDGVEINSASGNLSIGNDSNSGAINVGTGAAARVITIGNNAAGSSIVLDGTTTINGALDVKGDVTSFDSTIINMADRYLYLNKDYTSAVGQSGGIVVNSLPTATGDVSGAGGFATTSTINTVGAATFAPGDIIQISGAANVANDGLFEVLTHAANLLTIDLTATEDFSQNLLTVDVADVTAVITKISVSVIRQDGAGVWEVGTGNAVPITYTALSLGVPTTTLNDAYVNGNTITTSVTEGNVSVAGTEDFLVTTSDVDIDVTATVSIDASTSITIGGDADTSTIDIGTSASSRVITVGNLTGATGVTINSGTEQVEINAITHYGVSAGNPTATSSGFQAGDKYYDSNLNMEMRYDSSRSKWLSLESVIFQFGRNGNVNQNQYYRAINGRILSATIGFHAENNGTLVALGYTRTDSDVAVFDVVSGGVSFVTLDSSAATGTNSSGRSTTLNADFTAGGILAVKNQAGSNTTTNVQAWFKIKFRG